MTEPTRKRIDTAVSFAALTALCSPIVLIEHLTADWPGWLIFLLAGPAWAAVTFPVVLRLNRLGRAGGAR